MIFTFGIIHTMAYIMSDATLVEINSSSTNLGSFFGIAGTIEKIAFFDYSFLDGSFFLLKFVLATIQGVFVFFALKEILDYGRGR